MRSWNIQRNVKDVGLKCSMLPRGVGVRSGFAVIVDMRCGLQNVRRMGG